MIKYFFYQSLDIAWGMDQERRVLALVGLHYAKTDSEKSDVLQVNSRRSTLNEILLSLTGT